MRLYLIALLAYIAEGPTVVDGQTGDCDDFKADVVFLLDTSESISADDLSKLVDFLKRVVRQVKISQDDVRVSVVTFAEESSLAFSLTDHSDEGGVVSNLDAIGLQDGPVRIDRAFDFLTSGVFPGGPFRPGVGRVIVLVTDDSSVDRNATLASLDNIKGDNYTIITLGIGDNVLDDELADIASDPDDRFLLKVDSFADLDEYIGTFSGSLCEALLPVVDIPIADGSCESFRADVVFAIDNSHSVKQVNFDKVIRFVSKIIESMTIGEDGVRVGLFLFSTDVTPGFALGAYNTKDEVLAAVRNIDYTGGLTNTHLALDYLKSDMFSSNKNRPNVTDIVILISDGQSTDSDETIKALGRIESEGYTIFTLGITDDIDKDELNAISSDPASTYSVTVKGFDDLQGILDAFATQICEETSEATCDRSQADIIILLDASSSIKRANFEKVKKFLADLVRQFTISPDDVRVALLTFATKTRLEFHLDAHQTKGGVLAAIREVKYTRGKTYTNKAIKVLREDMLQGHGNRPDVTDIVVVLTDGKSTKSEDTKAEIRQLKKIPLVVFSIGIGDKVDTEELNAISSDPSDFFSSLVDDFDSLDSIKESFTQKACEVTPPPPIQQPKCRATADLLIIMDASSSIGDSDYNKQKVFVKELIRNFDVGPDGVQIALIVFNSEAYVEFYLNTFNDTDNILAAVDKAHGVASGTYTNLALQKAHEEVFQESRGSRDFVPKLTILLTDGESRKPDLTEEQAEKLRGANVVIIAVGIGGNIDEDELKLIASDPDDTNVLRAANFNILSSLLESIVNVTCEAAVPPIDPPADSDCDDFKADVVFLLDTSKSISTDDLSKLVDFLKRVVQQVKISQDDVRVSVVTFAEESSLVFSLTDHSDEGEVVSNLDAIGLQDGPVRIDRAFDFLTSGVFPGGPFRPGVGRVIVLVTDDSSVDRNATLASLDSIKGDNYTIITLGIGDNVLGDELADIASDPDDRFLLKVDSVADLDEYIGTLSGSLCEALLPVVDIPIADGSCESFRADVVFAIDNSHSVKQVNFDKVIRFVSKIIESMTIGEDGVRVGLFLFSTDVTPGFALGAYNTKDEVLAAVRNVGYTGGLTNTHLALDYLKSDMFSSNKNRPNVTDIVILISDGQSTDSDETLNALGRIESEGYTIFTLGITDDIDKDELNAISSDPASTHSVTVKGFDDLQGILDAFATQICEETTEATCDRSQADIIILLDASSSIKRANFEKVKKFLADLVRQFTISPDDVRVALLTFATKTRLEFHLDAHQTKGGVLAAIREVKYTRGKTYTNKAIKVLREDMLQGHGNRPDVTDIVVVLTDGKSTNSEDTKAEIRQLKKIPLVVFSIGIGDKVDTEELNAISSDPSDFFSSLVDDFDSLDSIKESFTQKACEVTPPPPIQQPKCRATADLLIIMDASSSIGDSDYNKQKVFVKELIRNFDVGPDGVQIALIVFNSEAYVEFYLNTFNDTDDILAAVDKAHGVASGTYTNLALQKAHEEVFQESRGSRDFVPKLTILLTDGESRKPDLTEEQAEKLRGANVVIIAVGIGGNIDEDELKLIASDPDDTNVLRAANFNILSSLLESIVNVTCEAAVPPIDPPVDTCKYVGDLVLVVDISTSVGMAEIAEVKRVLKDIINELDVGNDRVRVSLVTYDITAEVIHQLKGEQSRGDLLWSIDKISKPGYGSWAHRAFHMIRTEVLQKSSGERQNANDVVVVFTDGLTREPSKASLEAEKLKENGAKVILVGTTGYYEKYLRALSSAPSGDFFFTVKDFNGYDRIKDLLLDQKCSKPTSCGVEADVVVLMDASTSIEKEDFGTMKDFVKDLLSGFEIGPSHVRVGLATFNYDAIIEFQLRSFSTKRQVLLAVDAVSGRGADTRTDKALKVVREVMFSEDNGNRPGVPDILIVLTDGRSKYPEETINQALKIHEEKITVFAIGIGSRISDKELKAMASSPSNKYEVQDFQGLSDIESSLQRKACGLPPPTDPDGVKIQADIVFVIDSCDRVLETHFQLALQFASYIVKSVRVSRKWARFGIIKYATDAVLEMTLDSYFTRNDILTAISQIERSGWDFRVEKALRQLRTLAFKDCLGGRPDVPDVAIILTSGQFTHIDAARYEAMLMKNAGIRTFVIGIGRYVDKFQLEILSNTPYSKTVFVAETTEDIHNTLAQLMMELNSELNVCY